MTMDATMDGTRRLADFAVAARAMAKPVGLEQTLGVVLGHVRQSFLADAVGILLVESGQPTSAAASAAGARRADALQLECGEGPCLETLTKREGLAVDSLPTDTRWQVWGPQAADLGWRSHLSIGLRDDDHIFGCLSLYSRQSSFFTPDDLDLGEVFGAYVAIALAGARERDSLLKAVESRHAIGQAQGILMERFGIEADQAFTVLRRYSSHTNRKLRCVAEEVVVNRRLPPSSQADEDQGGPWTPKLT